MAQDRPFLGILLMLGFCVAAPLGDSMAKLLGDTVPVAQLVTVRFVIQALLLAPFLALGLALPRGTRILGLIALRTVLHIAGIGMMFLALTYLPVAEAIAIAFVMPFIMLLLGWAVLGEEVGMRRLAACAVGFAGTLMVVQPTFAEVGPPALLPLGVAVVFALFMLTTRTVAKAVDPIALQLVSGVMASAVLLPVTALGWAAGWAPLVPVMPTAGDLWLLAALGVLGTLAHLLMTWSLRFAPAATLAPMQYLEIPVATLVGWAIFRDLPDGLAAAGICVTVAAGLYIVLRERALTRPSAPPPPRPAPPAV
ncbi:DMT family transporter [Rhodobacteraceae bacterium CCMM004]|nr:DMT family transporter [Rhodobacteraceae bacterium CCMM004]